MPLEAGTQLGPYEILSPLGAEVTASGAGRCATKKVSWARRVGCILSIFERTRRDGNGEEASRCKEGGRDWPKENRSEDEQGSREETSCEQGKESNGEESPCEQGQCAGGPQWWVPVTLR